MNFKWFVGLDMFWHVSLTSFEIQKIFIWWESCFLSRYTQSQVSINNEAIQICPQDV